MNDTQINVKNALDNLLSGISERSRDVVVSRFGIGQENYETLEAIGQRYGITRERVRQIEADVIRHIKEKKSDSVLAPLLTSLESFISTYGGVVEEETLTREFTKRHLAGTENPSKYQGLVRLLLTVSPQFKKAQSTDAYLARWYTNKEALERQERIVAEIVQALKTKKSLASKEELAQLALAGGLENHNSIETYLASSKEIKENVFGQWGLSHWAEVRPRGVKDKAYLVMKQVSQPIHFREVARLINEHDFSSRPALAQTVHNELIKDNRFVLVGRGLYALREWGYKEGTVKDVIERVLREKGPLLKDEVVDAVLAERFVKPSTIILNLNSFKKTGDDRYTLV